MNLDLYGTNDLSPPPLSGLGTGNAKIKHCIGGVKKVLPNIASEINEKNKHI